MINKDELFLELSAVNSILRRKINLVACGGTAMTLLNVKPSTIDIDFLVPREDEHTYLIKTLKSAGYEEIITDRRLKSATEFLYDLFRGQSVYSTELLEDPLAGENNLFINEWSNIYLGCLNYYDLIITKLFRGAETDYRDIYLLWQKIFKEIDFDKLKSRYADHAKYGLNEKRLLDNFECFEKEIKDRGCL